MFSVMATLSSQRIWQNDKAPKIYFGAIRAFNEEYNTLWPILEKEFSRIEKKPKKASKFNFLVDSAQKRKFTKRLVSNVLVCTGRPHTGSTNIWVRKSVISRDTILKYQNGSSHNLVSCQTSGSFISDLWIHQFLFKTWFLVVKVKR